eukprot:COSAG01_NODE_13584_length_1564_cov_1.036860_2_plen_151_part_00
MAGPGGISFALKDTCDSHYESNLSPCNRKIHSYMLLVAWAHCAGCIISFNTSPSDHKKKMLLVWPVGVPAVLLLTMLRVRELIEAQDRETLDRFAFAIGDYKPEYWYWEVVELARKLVLSGLDTNDRVVVCVHCCCCVPCACAGLQPLPF